MWADSSAEATGTPDAQSPRQRLWLTLDVNGRPREVDVESRTTLGKVLRGHWHCPARRSPAIAVLARPAL